MRNILSEAQKHVIEPYTWSDTLLAFDFDGTLAPTVANPSRAAMRPRTRDLLRRVAGLYPTIVISGRGLSDVRKRVKGLGLRRVVGSHGVEPWGANSAVHRRVEEWRPVFERALVDEPGVVIEDKAYSLAVHYRRSRAKKRVRARITEVASGLDQVRMVGGIDVMNIVPKDAPHKGMAFERERARLRCDTGIYVGDDETDEDVFALDQPGRLLSVRVGRTVKSRADFYLRCQADIDSFLEVLAALRGKGASSSARRNQEINI